MSLNTVNSKQLNRLVKLCVTQGKTLYVEGPPGCGKTAIIRQAVSELDRSMRYECAAYLTQANFGLPCPDPEGRWLNVLRPDTWFDKPHVLFFDEADKLSPMLQQLMSQVAHERRLGDDRLPEGSGVILAGNRTQDANGSYGVSNILTSRTMRVSFKPDAQEVMDYAFSVGWHPLLIAALDMNHSLINDAKPNADRFPCSRAWENVSTLLKAEPDQGIWPIIISGHVGDSASAEVIALIKCYDKMVPVSEILRNPLRAPIPNDPSVRMIQCYTLVASASGKDMPAILKYISRMPGDLKMSMLAKLSRARTAVWIDAVRELGTEGSPIFKEMQDIIAQLGMGEKK